MTARWGQYTDSCFIYRTIIMLSQNSCYQGYLLVENTSLDLFYHQIGINYMIAGPLLTFEGGGGGNLFQVTSAAC